MVGIEVDSEYFCGGSLICKSSPNETRFFFFCKFTLPLLAASTVVLTAAHCVLDARAFVVTAGAHRHADPEPTQQIQVSTEAIIHPDWTRYIVENDIAIIKTVGPFTYNGRRPIFSLY